MGDQQKLVVINEKEQYSVQKLFNIGDNLRVKQFLLQVCYTAIEEIGFEKFDIQSNYEDFLARLCVDLTQFSDSTGGSSLQGRPGSFDRHRVSIKLKDLKSKAFYEECSIEYLGDTGRWVKRMSLTFKSQKIIESTIFILR